MSYGKGELIHDGFYSLAPTVAVIVGYFLNRRNQKKDTQELHSKIDEVANGKDGENGG